MKVSKHIVLAAAALFALSSPAMAGGKIGNCEVTGEKLSLIHI